MRKFMYYVLNDDNSVRGTNDTSEWAEMFQNADRRIVKQEKVGGLSVSTVFLGIDHSFTWHYEAPVVFETMIFGLPDDEEYQERYCTWEEAEAGHARAVMYAQSKSPAN